MKLSEEQELIVRELDRKISKKIELLINKKFDEIEQKMLLKGTTLVNASDASKIVGVSRTCFYGKGMDQTLPHIDLPEGARRYIAELIVPSLAGIL